VNRSKKEYGEREEWMRESQAMQDSYKTLEGDYYGAGSRCNLGGEGSMKKGYKRRARDKGGVCWHAGSGG